MPIVYSAASVRRQLNVASRKLQYFKSPALAAAMREVGARPCRLLSGPHPTPFTVAFALALAPALALAFSTTNAPGSKLLTLTVGLSRSARSFQTGNSSSASTT